MYSILLVMSECFSWCQSVLLVLTECASRDVTYSLLWCHRVLPVISQWVSCDVTGCFSLSVFKYPSKSWMRLRSGDCGGHSRTVRTPWSSLFFSSCVKASKGVLAHYPAAGWIPGRFNAQAYLGWSLPSSGASHGQVKRFFPGCAATVPKRGNITNMSTKHGIILQHALCLTHLAAPVLALAQLVKFNNWPTSFYSFEYY